MLYRRHGLQGVPLSSILFATTPIVRVHSKNAFSGSLYRLLQFLG
jgi:hypothetical protein